MLEHYACNVALARGPANMPVVVISPNWIILVDLVPTIRVKLILIPDIFYQ